MDAEGKRVLRRWVIESEFSTTRKSKMKVWEEMRKETYIIEKGIKSG